MSKIGRVGKAAASHDSTVQHISITVSMDMASCRREWLALQDRAITTVFQTYEWLEAWQAHVGSHNAVQPIIVTGRYANGRCAFILPFGLVTSHWCRILTWLSYPHSNYGYGIYDPEFLQAGAKEFPAIWQKILTVLPRLDAIALHNQPVRGGGCDNPFGPLATCASIDNSYILELNGEMEDLLARKFSSRSRRRQRQQERELDEIGNWRLVDARSDDEVTRAIGATLAQKRQQLESRGITNPFDRPFRDFFRQFSLARFGINRAARCHYMEFNGEIIATILGAVHKGTYYGMITSMTDGPLKDFSPGSMMIRYAIEQSCGDGIHSFDFSTGYAEYKARWADSELPLFETLKPLSARGMVYCAIEWARITIKRRIKSSPYLLARAKKLRAWLRR